MIGNRVNSASPSTFDSPLTRVFWTSLYGMPVAVIPASRNSFAVWSGTLTSLSAMTSGFKAAISALISGCRSLQRLWFCSRLSVATRNCIGLSRRLRIHRLCWVTIPLSRRGVYRIWGAALLLLVLYLAPVLVSLCLADPRRGVPWYQARRDPTGLSPDPAATQEAVIQVFAAPAVSWRGIFSVHTWIAVKPAGAPRFTRYEVLGFGVANGAPAVWIDRMGLTIIG